MEEKLLRIVEEQYPKTKGRIAHVSSGTPLTNNFYLGSVNGEVWCVERRMCMHIPSQLCVVKMKALSHILLRLCHMYINVPGVWPQSHSHSLHDLRLVPAATDPNQRPLLGRTGCPLRRHCGCHGRRGNGSCQCQLHCSLGSIGHFCERVSMKKCTMFSISSG